MIDEIYCHVDNDPEFMLNAAQLASNLTGAPLALPLPVDAESLERLIQTYPKATPKPERLPPKPRDYKKLLPAHVAAYELYKRAVAEIPGFANATDGAVYRWLREHSLDAAQLPPTEISFIRYLRTARKHLDGQTKREHHRQSIIIPTTRME